MYDDWAIDLSELRDPLSIIIPYLNLEDLENMRLASRELEKMIRRTYFHSNFRVRLTQASFTPLRPELASFVTKVDDSESGGRLALLFSRTLQDVKVRHNPNIDWNSLIQLTNLQTLRLSSNQLAAVPESISRLSNLHTLSLGCNQLTAVPESIGQLTNLQTLDLRGNRLTAVPESIGQLSSLQALLLSSNQLTAVPESIGQLSRLQTLYLNGNQLTAVPESIGQLSSLQILYLNGNRLTAVPESIGQLSSLQELSLWHNQLSNATKARLSEQFGNKVGL